MLASPPLRSGSILLLDADLRTSQRLALLLAEDGFPVEVFGDGASAIARLGRPPSPRVLITELSLPIVDGATVARFAAAKSPTLSVIVLTRHPNLFDAASFGMTAPAVLTKPLDYTMLMGILRGQEAPSDGAGAAFRKH